MNKDNLVIGGASGFWGEASHATAQLLGHPGLDVLVYDYLAEVTMSIMARAWMKDADKGYALDFVTEAMKPNLKTIAANGVKVLTNAGGINPAACAAALRAVIKDAGLDLKVAVVEGDNLLPRAAEFADEAEMFSGAAFPPKDKVASINAYLGAMPIVAALGAGADIVITGRCVDSALTLAAAAHHFGWAAEEYDLMCAGSLAGHILECGPQATGGNFTDWELAGDIADIGYPIAEIAADGSFVVTKPEGTTGVVSREAVAEQMLYEIGDPQAYLLPDVACDFSEVTLMQAGENRVLVTGAKGRAPSGQLKTSVTCFDGFRAGSVFQYSGVNARAKGEAFVNAGLDRARGKLRALNAPDYDEVSIEAHGGRPGDGPFEEITIKAAVKHADARAVGLFLKEVIGGALATPPGLHFFTAGGRPKPSPVLRLYSFLIDAGDVPVAVTLEGAAVPFAASAPAPAKAPAPHRPPAATGDATRTVPLEALAVARSGDKGDAANIGIIARHPDLMPWIWQAMDEDAVRDALPTVKGRVDRFYLPGSAAMNILCQQALGGGGVASILNDPQGKAFGQRLLAVPVAAPAELIASYGKGI